MAFSRMAPFLLAGAGTAAPALAERAQRLAKQYERRYVFGKRDTN
jgi:hypothetical protein